jgi:hypothetical protein
LKKYERCWGDNFPEGVASVKKAVYGFIAGPWITNDSLESFQCGETIDSSMLSADEYRLGVRDEDHTVLFNFKKLFH